MERNDRGSRGEGRARSASLLASDLAAYGSVLRETGRALEKMHQLLMTRVCADDEVELAEQLNDELKPLLDYLIHFEVRRG